MLIEKICLMIILSAIATCLVLTRIFDKYSEIKKYTMKAIMEYT